MDAFYRLPCTGRRAHTPPSSRRGVARSKKRENAMAKGLDKKKEQKKKPAKTLKEKRAEKHDKKAGKTFLPT